MKRLNSSNLVESLRLFTSEGKGGRGGITRGHSVFDNGKGGGLVNRGEERGVQLVER